MEASENPKPRGATRFVGILLTLALYFSGPFVLITPLPMIHVFLRSRTRALWEVVLPCLAVLTVVYIFLAPPLHALFRAYPQFSWLLSVPGIQYLDLTGRGAVALFGLGYFLFFASAAFLLFKALTRKEDPSRLVAAGAAVFFTIAVLLFLAYSLAQGSSPAAALREYSREALESFISLQQEEGQSLEQVATLRENAQRLIRYSVMLSPSLLFCGILVVLVLNLALAKKFFTPFFRALGPFRLNGFRMPFSTVWAAILTGSALLLHSLLAGSELSPTSPLALMVKGEFPFLLIAGANLLVVLGFAFYLQGLAIISFILERKKVPPLARLLIYGTIFLLQLLPPFQGVVFLIGGMGFFDSWFDFRKLAPPPPKNEG